MDMYDKGRAEGVKQATTKAIAKKLLSNAVDLDIVVKVTGLAPEAVELIKTNI